MNECGWLFNYSAMKNRICCDNPNVKIRKCKEGENACNLYFIYNTVNVPHWFAVQVSPGAAHSPNPGLKMIQRCSP